MPRANPPPHLRIRATAGRPLPAAFEAALAARLAAEPERARRLGRLRRRAKALPPESLPDLCRRLASLGLEAPRVHAVPYLPPESGARPLVLVVTEASTPSEGVFLARRGGRWLPRPRLRDLLERLDPAGGYLRAA